MLESPRENAVNPLLDCPTIADAARRIPLASSRLDSALFYAARPRIS
jgi:hypothetical protein